jgi:hypothetical protein
MTYFRRGLWDASMSLCVQDKTGLKMSRNSPFKMSEFYGGFPQQSSHSRHPVKTPKLVIRSWANFGCPLRLSTDSGYRPLCQGIGWKKKEKEERRAGCRGFDWRLFSFFSFFFYFIKWHDLSTRHTRPLNKIRFVSLPLCLRVFV